VQRYEVIVVGAGPAGTGTALALAQLAPELASRTLLLEKAAHPRDKTCAGGLIPRTHAVLHELGVVVDVPAARVDHAAVVVPGGQVRIGGSDLCRVIRRRHFDAALARAAAARGVRVQERARVVGLRREAGGVRVETETATYWAPVVVGADGSGSLVRRQLVGGPGGPIARAIACDVPVPATRWDGFDVCRYDFDFLVLARGLRGYGWTFPCLVDGLPHANVGVYALPPYDAGTMHAEMQRLLAGIGNLATPRWRAFPIHTYTPAARLAAANTLLVGDAAGVDPLMGEGISFALEYGRLAAQAIVEARAAGTLDFAHYETAVHGGPLGRKLRRLVWAAERCYGPRWRVWLRLARSSPRLQRAALDWYNGVAPWEGRGRLALARALLRGARSEAA
jgi:geranylgeranyl reductase family protein